MLSPVSQQFLMKHAPDAINVECRKDHEDIIAKYVDQDADFKYKAWNFFLEKHKEIKMSDFEEYHTLSSDSLSEIEMAGRLADFRRFESEIFGAGEYFIVGNNIVVDEIPFTQKSSIGYAIRLQEAGGIPQDISDVDHFIKDNINSIELRGIVNGIPSAITVMDVGAFLMDGIGTFSDNHVKTLTPCHHSEDLFIDDEGYEMVKITPYFENELHSNRFVAMLHEKIYRGQINIIDEMVSEIPNDFKIVTVYHNDTIEMSRINIIVKNLKGIDKLTIHNLMKDTTYDSTEFIDDALENANAKVMDLIDTEIEKLEQEEREHHEKFRQQEEDRKNGIVDFSQKKLSLDYLNDGELMSVERYEEEQREKEDYLFSVYDFY